jgi:hypothetical protein
MRWTFAVLTFALGWSLMAGVAQAAPKKQVQVVAIYSDDAYEQAQALTIALKRAVSRADGWALASGDFSLEVMVTAMNCQIPPDAACMKKVAAKVGTPQFVWGIMKKDGAEVVTDLKLWEKGANNAETELRYASNLTDASDDTLLKLAEGAFSKLAGVAEGAVVLTAGKVTGQVLVDGQAAGSITDGRTELILPAGDHEIRVRAKGYNEAVGTVTVPPGGRAELSLLPTRSGDADAAIEADSADIGAKTSTRSVIGYVSLGVGAVLIGGGVFSMIRVHAINNDTGFDRYRRGLKSDQDVCDEADKGTLVPGASSARDIQEQCSTASTFQTLQYVFLGAGAAAVATGAILVIGDSSSGKERARSPAIEPLIGIGPRGGSVDVRVLF